MNMDTEKSQALSRLFYQQTQDFPLARDNYRALAQAVCKEIPLDGFCIRVQYNPARIISTNAKTDATSLRSRKCFLCPSGMPETQQGMAYGDRYHIYINPYPIFRQHFTVPSNEHLPQRIAHRFEDMLDIATDFPEHVVFYNGPASGASAPDHFHFQLVSRGEMPIEADAANERLRQVVRTGEDYTIAILRDYLREVFILESASKARLRVLFDALQRFVGITVPYEAEPQFNLFAWQAEGCLRVCLFPRRRWRPRQFFEEGEGQIMFSPGCADMAGLIIAPRQRDFERYDAALLADLFQQVSITPEEREQIVHLIQQF